MNTDQNDCAQHIVWDSSSKIQRFSMHCTDHTLVRWFMIKYFLVSNWSLFYPLIGYCKE